ncbi:hypothetical protein [Bradyrhizobium sp. Ec3.3]|uniref:hypothetical protein n=1 Tax=Bradyrhizobium sp. Ec3.3 TaxID=189753 RepID=UPI002737DA3D|nr:hypothetical protein [Bradyrhizobium sp. Ec3.3]
MLADMGADMIKIEKWPKGHDTHPERQSMANLQGTCSRNTGPMRARLKSSKGKARFVSAYAERIRAPHSVHAAENQPEGAILVTCGCLANTIAAGATSLLPRVSS